MLPNFLHIGAAKCASSWLWRVCIEHPDIYVPNPPDNVNFFTVAYHRGLDWYRDTYFADHADQPVAGEFSNSYMCHEPALMRIAKHMPDVKLTMTVRNPIDRAYLQWAHIHLKNKPYGLDPDKGIGLPLEKVLHHHGHSWFRLWIDPSLYAFHIERILRYFHEDQLLITFHEDLVADPGEYLSTYFEFLGVDAAFRPSILHQQVNADSDRTDPATGLDGDLREQLRDVFADDIALLAHITGRDLSHWQ